jgi:hypothetical protein
MNNCAQLLSALLFVLATSSAAQTLPEGLFTLAKFELGKATISDVQAHFGPSTLRPLEPGDGPDRAVCYSNGRTASAPTVIFETGALGGWKEITAYRLTTRHRRQCDATAVSIEDLSTGNGLQLFAAKKTALQAINKPETASSAKVRVEQVYQRKATPDEATRIRLADPGTTQLAFDVVDAVEVRFKGSVVDDLYVKRLVSY